MSIQVKGFSCTWRDNLPEYKRLTRQMIAKAKAVRNQVITDWALFVQYQAAIRTPSYGGDLANAIQIDKNLSKDIATARVGVSTDWQSNFDDDYQKTRGEMPEWGISSPQLAMMIHEIWDSVASPRGKARAARKGAKYGVSVGSGFLTRAIDENLKELSTVARTMFSDNLSRHGGDIIPFSRGLPATRGRLPLEETDEVPF